MTNKSKLDGAHSLRYMEGQLLGMVPFVYRVEAGIPEDKTVDGFPRVAVSSRILEFESLTVSHYFGIVPESYTNCRRPLQIHDIVYGGGAPCIFEWEFCRENVLENFSCNQRIPRVEKDAQIVSEILIQEFFRLLRNILVTVVVVFNIE